MRVSPYLMRPLRSLSEVLDSSGGAEPSLRAARDADRKAGGDGRGTAGSGGARVALRSGKNEAEPQGW